MNTKTAAQEEAENARSRARHHNNEAAKTATWAAAMRRAAAGEMKDEDRAVLAEAASLQTTLARWHAGQAQTFLDQATEAASRAAADDKTRAAALEAAAEAADMSGDPTLADQLRHKAAEHRETEPDEAAQETAERPTWQGNVPALPPI